MNLLFAGNIVISEMESESLMSRLQNPDREYIDFRNDVFSHADESISLRTEGTGFIADIPELDLSFLDTPLMELN